MRNVKSSDKYMSIIYDEIILKNMGQQSIPIRPLFFSKKYDKIRPIFLLKKDFKPP